MGRAVNVFGSRGTSGKRLWGRSSKPEGRLSREVNRANKGTERSVSRHRTGSNRHSDMAERTALERLRHLEEGYLITVAQRMGCAHRPAR